MKTHTSRFLSILLTLVIGAVGLQAEPNFQDAARFGRVVSENALVRVCSSGNGDRPELHGCLVRGPVQERAFVTEQEQLPWIILDLRATRQITGLHVINASHRKKPIAATKPLTVEISSDLKAWRLVYEAGDTEAGADWKIDLGAKSGPARYVRIGLKQSNPRVFQLSRVTVYGK